MLCVASQELKLNRRRLFEILSRVKGLAGSFAAIRPHDDNFLPR